MSRTGNRDCSHGKWQRIQNTAWESLQVSSFYSYLLTTQLLKQQQQRKSCYCLAYAMRPPCADQYCCRNPPEVRLAPCNLGPPSNSREQHGVIPGFCPREKSPLSTMDQYLYSRLHASIYLDWSCLRFMKLCTKSTNGDSEKTGKRNA